LENTRPSDEDHLLVQSILDREDEEAFGRLFDKYRDPVYNFSFRYLGNAEDAADCTQEVFIKVHINMERFRFESKFSTWLYSIVRNNCLNMIRSRKRRSFDQAEGVEAGFLHNVSTEERNGPDELLHRQEIEVVFQEGLSLLKHNQKMAVILRDIEGRSYEEISDITGLRLGTVKSTLARARFRMAEHLKKFGDEH
jgi:RNA polymerase sigma-70 factor (ECF subfamily)